MQLEELKQAFEIILKVCNFVLDLLKNFNKKMFNMIFVVSLQIFRTSIVV